MDYINFALGFAYDDPEDLMPGERLDVITSILAEGVMRLIEDGESIKQDGVSKPSKLEQFQCSFSICRQER